MHKRIATDLVNFYEKYYMKEKIFLFAECLTIGQHCAMIVSIKWIIVQLRTAIRKITQ